MRHGWELEFGCAVSAVPVEAVWDPTSLSISSSVTTVRAGGLAVLSGALVTNGMSVRARRDVTVWQRAGSGSWTRLGAAEYSGFTDAYVLSAPVARATNYQMRFQGDAVEPATWRLTVVLADGQGLDVRWQDIAVEDKPQIWIEAGSCCLRDRATTNIRSSACISALVRQVEVCRVIHVPEEETFRGERHLRHIHQAQEARSLALRRSGQRRERSHARHRFAHHARAIARQPAGLSSSPALAASRASEFGGRALPQRSVSMRARLWRRVVLSHVRLRATMFAWPFAVLRPAVGTPPTRGRWAESPAHDLTPCDRHHQHSRHDTSPQVGALRLPTT